jgi:2-iminobutanoate/2-iminopropanoate deaminase
MNEPPGKTVIRTDRAPTPSGSYSQAVRYGHMLYVAGTCPFELGTGKVLYPGDIKAQTGLVLQYLSEILSAAGSSLQQVVKVTVFLDDMDRFREYDEVYRTFFSLDPPARSTVEIGKFPPGMCVEIECIAGVTDQ